MELSQNELQTQIHYRLIENLSGASHLCNKHKYSVIILSKYDRMKVLT